MTAEPDQAGDGPDPGIKPGVRLRAELRPILSAYKGLVRGLDRDFSGRLTLAFEAYRTRLALEAEGQQWRLALRRAAALLHVRKPIIGSYVAGVGAPGTWWQPEDDALTPVLTLPVIDWCDPLIHKRMFGGEIMTFRAGCSELLALDPDDPKRWWRNTGAVSVLGADWAMAPSPLADGSSAPIRLIEHPLDWARAGGEASGALCLLDPESPEAGGARAILLGDNPIVCLGKRDQAVTFAKRVERLQRKFRPKLPKVLVKKGRAA